MSTEIKNTLFRFVTMRTPKAIETQYTNKSFINYVDYLSKSADPVLNVFYEAATHVPSNKTKAKVLSETAATFASSAFTRKEALFSSGTIDESLYYFAMWLTSNRTKLTPEMLETYPGGDISMIDLIEGEVMMNKLWENLFYQIITFKSGEVRDAILSVLVANRFLEYYLEYSTSTETLRDLAQSRVVLPKELFGKEDTTAKREMYREALNALPINTKDLEKEMKVILYEERITRNNSLIEGLKKGKKYIEKINREAFEVAKSNHEELLENAYSTAEKTIKTYTEPGTGIERSYIEYEDLVLPKFEYTASPENTSFGQFLDNNQIEIINNTVEVYYYDTYDQLINHYETQNTAIAQIISQNTNSSENVISTGGVIIPTSTGISADVFSIGGGHNNTNIPLTLLFNGSAANKDIIAANYTVTFNDDAEATSTTFTDSISKDKLLVKLFTEKISLLGKTGFHIEGDLTLSDGRIMAIKGDAQITLTTFKYAEEIALTDGFPSYFEVNGNGSYIIKAMVIDPENELPQDIETPSEDGSVLNYIPSGYGVKRLGIADYRKVEQEVCCYVPGEVSHIENVMASEYKEKATRRLRRNENTTTSSSEKETERLTDTTSTDRFEMNQEVSAVLSDQTSFGTHGQYNWGSGSGLGGSVSSDFAYNTSSEESDLQAITHAKDVSERVLDRVVQKVKEERISKVIEEFEETSKHGFDNRRNSKHVSGVYRWVDKIYRNKILNYGKRLMYEFMIPEPAVFHNEASLLKTTDADIEILSKPVDPRSVKGEFELSNYKKINAANSSYWASAFNAEIESMPATTIFTGKSITIDKIGTSHESATKSEMIKIDERYFAKKAQALISGHDDTDNSQHHSIAVLYGDTYTDSNLRVRGMNSPVGKYVNISNFRNEVPVSIYYYNYHAGAVNINIECELTEEARDQWKIQTFNTIISAYEDRLAEYNAKLAEKKALQQEKLKTNPLFYRQIENTVLRKNCIEYMVSHDYPGHKSFIGGTGVKGTQALYDSKELETYAAKIKFFEQAFEWNLMSYIFYPFYWADKENWNKLYNVSETDDFTFRAFLQSGMARVVVSVRPGFEEAVNWYMATGQVWNGGQVPTMDDPMFLSIVEELRETTGEVEETWETRIPTSLTIIQAGSIGLEVTHALPCDDDCADYKLFDSDGEPVLDEDGNPISTNPIKIQEKVRLRGLENDEELDTEYEEEEEEGEGEGEGGEPIIPDPGDGEPPVES